MKTTITLLCLLVFGLMHAQWNSDTAVNTLVADSTIGDMQALGATTGETYVVFWNPVAAPTNFELRMQVLDSAGNQTLGNDGMLLSDQIPMGTFTVIWKIIVDADDNIYVSVTGTGGGDPAFVFKLDTDGNHLWDSNGVGVGSGNVVTVLPLASGDAIVSWLSSGGAVMQKYDSNGDTVWPNTQPITTGSGQAAPANFFEISGGEYIAVFHQLIGGINSNLYAQRYDGDGMAQWANAAQLSDKNTAFNRSYDGTQSDDAVFMSYFGPTGNQFNNYLQRVNLDGTLPWGINGSDFSTNVTDNESASLVAINEDASAIYAVATYSNSNQSLTGEFIQKFDAVTGARQFTDTAKEIYAIGEEKVHAGSMYLLGDTPWFLIKNGADNGATPTTLEAIYLDENGEFVWPEQTRPVATFSANKSRIQYTAPASAQSVAVFIEDKGDGTKIYAQNNVDESLSVAENNIDLIKIRYNNPVSDALTLKSSQAIQSITMVNLTGQMVYSKTIENLTDVLISLEHLNTGIYLMNVLTDQGEARSFKILKR